MSNTKDPEAPYSDNETPGKPGWNLQVARGTKRTKRSKSTKRTTGHIPNNVNDVG